MGDVLRSPGRWRPASWIGLLWLIFCGGAALATQPTPGTTLDIDEAIACSRARIGSMPDDVVLRDRDGRVTHTMASFSDVTEAKRLQQQLLQYLSTPGDFLNCCKRSRALGLDLGQQGCWEQQEG